jgi:hypothetical protein
MRVVPCLSICLLAIPLVACGKIKAYDGPELPTAEIATIEYDDTIDPLDERETAIIYAGGKEFADTATLFSGVQIFPGHHDLIIMRQLVEVECSTVTNLFLSPTCVRHIKSVSCATVEFEASAGTKYH